MKKIKYFLLLFGFIFMIPNAKALIVDDYTTKYYYYNNSDVLTQTEYRSGSNNSVSLFGRNNYGQNVTKFEYPAGFYNYIPLSFTNGKSYIVTVVVTATNIEDSATNETLLNRYADINYAHFSNGNVTGVEFNYTRTWHFAEYGEAFYNYTYTIVYKITATSSGNGFYLGTYNTNAKSLGFYNHAYESSYKVVSIDSIVDDASTQTSQNQIIINQNNVTNQKIDTTNKELENLNDNLTDESAPNTDDLSDASGWLPPGPLDSLINLPLSLFNAISRDLSATCEPIVLPLPYVDKNLTLPCIANLYDKIGIQNFINWVGRFVSAFILFSYLLKLYKWVDDTLSFRENNHLDNWGGI